MVFHKYLLPPTEEILTEDQQCASELNYTWSNAEWHQRAVKPGGSILIFPGIYTLDI